MKPLFVFLSTALLLTASSAFAQQGVATFEVLGNLPDGGTNSWALAVSGDGSVVVGKSESENGIEAFRWEDGKMEGLDDLPGGGFESVATSVSADGSVVVGSSISEDGQEAFRWEDGVMEGLGGLGGGEFGSEARGVSADGSVVVGQSNSVAGIEAFRWEDGEMEGLGDLPGDNFESVANGISADGSVIVGEGSSEFGTEAFRWEQGLMQGLGYLPTSGPFSSANAVSADGFVIVGVSGFRNVGGDSESFRWEEGVMERLRGMCETWSDNEAVAVSSDGSIVVGDGFFDEVGGNGFRTSFYWTEEGGMRRLIEVFENDYGLDLSEWIPWLFEVTGISADGSVIVGYGRRSLNGPVEAWRASLDSPIQSTRNFVGQEVKSNGRSTLRTGNYARSEKSRVVSRALITGSGEATFEGLGSLPGGCAFSSSAEDVSADGSVVVGVSSSENGNEAFRWANGEMEGLGNLPGGSDEFVSRASGVSADGSVVVGGGLSEEGEEAFRWENGEMEGLGDLPGGSYGSFAYDVSDSGAVVVGGANSTNGWEAFRWENGELEGLGDFPGGSFHSRAGSVSADGAVVVGSGDADGAVAFRWEDGEMVSYWSANGEEHSAGAVDVSADGSVFVGSCGHSAYVEPCRWHEYQGMGIGLGRLHSWTFTAYANAVSGNGEVIVGVDELEATYWTQEQGLRALQDVLESDYGLDLTGWMLFEATGISDDGTVIVGTGINPDGNTEAWRAAGLFPVGADPEAPDREAFALVNHPNPANASTKLTFSLNEPEEITLEVYDALGRLMSHVTWEVPAGANEVELSTASWPAGMYIARLRAGDREEQRRIMVVH